MTDPLTNPSAPPAQFRAPAESEESAAGPPAGRPRWIELYTHDVQAAGTFYSELLGWEITAGQEGEALANPVTIGGDLMGSIEPIAPTDDVGGWLITLGVAPGEEAGAVGRVESLGGTVVVPVTEVDSGVSYALVEDPSGARVGLISDDGGPMAWGPSRPVWFEVLTADLEADTAFYREVFGWRIHRMMVDGESFPYITNGQGAQAVCGIGDKAAFGEQDAPARWRVYFAVPDVDAATTRIAQLGGRVIIPPFDSPWGRLLSAEDPLGAGFMLVSLPG